MFPISVAVSSFFGSRAGMVLLRVESFAASRADPGGVGTARLRTLGAVPGIPTALGRHWERGAARPGLRQKEINLILLWSESE